MIASEKGYCDYPASACVSVNEEVVHGIPSKKRILQEGDIVSVDLVVEYKGYMADAARTYGVGEISSEAKRLIDTAEAAFFEGIKFAREGYRLYDISHAIQQKVEGEGFASSEILSVTVSAARCTKNRRFPTTAKLEKDRGFRRV